VTRAPEPTLATLYRLGAAPAAALRRLRAPEAALARLAPDLESLDLCRADATTALLAWPAVAAQIQPAVDRLDTAVRSLPEVQVVRPSREAAPSERHRIDHRPPSTAQRDADRRRITDLLETYAVGRRNQPAHDLRPVRAADGGHRRSQPFDERRGRSDRRTPASDAPVGKAREPATPAAARRRLRRAAERSGAPGAAHRIVAITGASATPEAALRTSTPATATPSIIPSSGAGPPAEMPPPRRSPLTQAAGEPVAARLVAALSVLEASRAQRRPMKSDHDDSARRRADAGEPVSEPQGPARSAAGPAPSDQPPAAAPSRGLRGLAERVSAPALRLDPVGQPYRDNGAPVIQPMREILTRHIEDILRHEARRHGIDVDEAGP
jgi:hypothetical protein